MTFSPTNGVTLPLFNIPCSSGAVYPRKNNNEAKARHMGSSSSGDEQQKGQSCWWNVWCPKEERLLRMKSSSRHQHQNRTRNKHTGLCSQGNLRTSNLRTWEHWASRTKLTLSLETLWERWASGWTSVLIVFFTRIFFLYFDFWAWEFNVVFNVYLK